MPTRVKTGALSGIDGLAVTVEVDLSRGLPGFHLVGLPNAEVKESRERVLAALRNSGLAPPPGKITVNLAPAGVRKQGASYDLAIAMGVMAAAEGRRSTADDAFEDCLFLGELSLFGELRPVRGLLAIVTAARQRGERRVVVPAEQVAEAALVAGVDVVGAVSLEQVVAWWRTGRRPATPPAETTGAQAQPSPTTAAVKDPANRREDRPLLAGLVGLPLVRKAAVVVAAGRHNLLLVGPPGTGKTRLARLLGRLQAPLPVEQGLEVTRIHSAAGTLKATAVMRDRPFRAPHHTITRAGLIGGGSLLRPGEVTLAHRGVLFLDELTEFRPQVLDVLREPMEEGTVSVCRGTGHVTFPADFQLIAAMNPCRCGFLGSGQRDCRCSRAEQTRYLNRLSGPLLDRFDLFLEVGAWQGAFLVRRPRPDRSGPTPGRRRNWRDEPKTGDVLQARRLLQGCRGAGPSLDDLEPGGARLLEDMRSTAGLSLRAVHRCLRVAATVAALDGSRLITRAHIGEALEFRAENVLPTFR